MPYDLTCTVLMVAVDWMNGVNNVAREVLTDTFILFFLL